MESKATRLRYQAERNRNPGPERRYDNFDIMDMDARPQRAVAEAVGLIDAELVARGLNRLEEGTVSP